MSAVSIKRLESLLEYSSPEMCNDELRMSDAERMAIADAVRVLKREALVQEVIRIALSKDSWEDVPVIPLVKAARKLAEFKP